eukprot:3480571-Amphidinium_carterae.6
MDLFPIVLEDGGGLAARRNLRQAALAAICSNCDPVSESLLVHRIRLVLKLIVKTTKVELVGLVLVLLLMSIQKGSCVQNLRLQDRRSVISKKKWETGAFGKVLTAVAASTKLPTIRGRSVAHINSALMPPTSGEGVLSCMDAVRADMRMQYNSWYRDRSRTITRNRHSSTCSESNCPWGLFDSIITYNVNKLPWTLIPDYIDMVYAEATFSILCLQEVFDDAGYDTDDVIDGWWDVNGHRILATKTLNNVDISWSTTNYNVAATVSYARIDPEHFLNALSCLDNECNQFGSVIVLGDYNAWVGRSEDNNFNLGSYNMEKTNERGLCLVNWCIEKSMRIISTLLPRHPYYSRVGWDGTLPSKFDHLALRLQSKQQISCGKIRNRGGRMDWKDPEVCLKFRQNLPDELPISLEDWHQIVCHAAAACITSKSAKQDELEDLGSKPTAAMLFPKFNKRKAHKRVTVLDDNDVPMATLDALHKLEDFLASKVGAIPLTMWPQSPMTPVKMDTTGLNWPHPNDYRKRVGNSLGFRGPSADVVHALPDSWLECIPSCMLYDASLHKLAHADYNTQKMVPLLKLRLGRLSYVKFRGIAVSGFTRSLYSIAILMLFRHWVPSSAHFSFAFTPNRSATALQLTIATATMHLTNWEGSACIAKFAVGVGSPYRLLQSGLSSTLGIATLLAQY